MASGEHLPARRDDQPAALSIPKALRELGIGEVDEDGFRTLSISDDARKHLNVLQPVREVAQADPYWRPSMRMIEVDLTGVVAPVKGGGRKKGVGNHHVYWIDDTLALSKNFILALAHAAGVTVEYTRRIQRAYLEDGEIGWEAAVLVRRSDGTLVRSTGSRIIDRNVEREVVKAQCQQWADNQRVFDADGKPVIDMGKFHHRWAQEREFLDAKAESKALLRACASLLQIKRGGYTLDDLHKPFLVIGWNFTPDYSDPDVRRMVTERGFNAADRLGVAGGMAAPEPDEPRALPPAAADPREPDPDDEPAAGAADEDEPEPEPAPKDASDGGTTPDAADAGVSSAASTEPTDAERVAALVERAKAAGETPITIGKSHPGKTIKEVHEAGDTNYIKWLGGSTARPDLAAAARLYERVIINGEITFDDE